MSGMQQVTLVVASCDPQRPFLRTRGLGYCVFACSVFRFRVCVFITAVPITKLFARGEGDSGGHVLRDTTSRGLSGLVCPSRTSERGGEGDCGGDCVNEGGCVLITVFITGMSY